MVLLGLYVAIACGTDEPIVGGGGHEGSVGASGETSAAGASGAHDTDSGDTAGHGRTAGPSSGGSSSGGSGTGAVGGGGHSGATSDGDTGGAPAPNVIDVTLSFESVRLSGARRTVDFRFVPGHDDELFVLGHYGDLYHFRVDGRSVTLLAQAGIPNTLQAKGCGALSFALDPKFDENHFIYIGRCVDLVTTTLSRYSLEDFEHAGDTEKEILKLTLERDRDEWHRFGSMGFESDGQTLWVLLGDMFWPEHAQDTTKKNGSLLRIVPSRDPDQGGYTQAVGNAFAPDSGSDADIYVYGIRSPWRGARDKYGRFWIGDVGDVTAEEVNLATAPGQNFGWQDHEGPCEEECAGIRDPIIHYGRSDGRAVWVGELYENPSIDRYYGWFDDNVFYGDFYGEWVRAVQVNEHGSIVANRVVGHLGEVTQWRVGPDGYMYAMTLSSYLYRVLPDVIFAEP